jgi:hypothetical protein
MQTNRRSKKMANYLLAYTGGGMAATEAEREQAMAAWGQWFGKLGSSVVAIGNPVGASTSVSASGSNGAAGSGLTGYSVIAADSLDAAASLVTDCPIIAAGGKVDVYETIEVM